MAKAGGKKKAANGYKLAEIIPAGEILEDVRQKKWRLGVTVGQGGFGRIYSAQDASSSVSSYPYVIKIEPHANGPLYVEMQFYMRNAKQEDINAFKQEHKLKTFGMPVFLGSGSHEFKGEKYRFLVTEHFGSDLWKIFLENGEIFPKTAVFKIGIQILDVIEYIHGRGYVHADIKGANILMGISKETKNKQVYLVDFGLACKFSTEKEFKPDPKKAHDGTIEYLSRDAHKGVQSRRGDLEILAYNLIQWLGCKLPWMNLLKNPKDVQESKEKCMKEIPKFIQMCFGKKTPPGPIVDYLNYITNLEFNTEPDYKYIRKILLSGVDSGDSLDKPFQFSKNTPVKRKSDTKAAPSPRRKITKIKKEKEVVVPSEEDEKENDLDTMEEKEDKVEETKVNDTPRKGRTRGRINYKEDSDDEIKSSKRKLVKKTKSQAVEDLHVTGDSLEGYTDAMKEVLLKKKQKTSKKKNKNKSDEDDVEEDMNGYNDEMKEIVTKKKSKKLKAVKPNSSMKATRQNNKDDVVNGDVDDSD